MTSSIVDNFCKSPTVRIICSALTHNCVLMILYVNFLPLDVVVMLLAFMLRVLMYADDLLLISSTCSDLRRMLRMVFIKPMVYNSITFNTAVFFWYCYTAHPYLQLHFVHISVRPDANVNYGMVCRYVHNAVDINHTTFLELQLKNVNEIIFCLKNKKKAQITLCQCENYCHCEFIQR